MCIPSHFHLFFDGVSLHAVLLYWLMPRRMIPGTNLILCVPWLLIGKRNHILSHPLLFHNMSSARAPGIGNHLFLICYLICGLLVMV